MFYSSGTKHKTMWEARSGNGSIKSFPRAGLKGKLAAPTKADTGLQNKTFHCETCDVHVNSETQLKQVSAEPHSTVTVKVKTQHDAAASKTWISVK